MRLSLSIQIHPHELAYVHIARGCADNILAYAGPHIVNHISDVFPHLRTLKALVIGAEVKIAIEIS